MHVSEANTEERRCAGTILLRLSSERVKRVLKSKYFDGKCLVAMELCKIVKENRVTLKN